MYNSDPSTSSNVSQVPVSYDCYEKDLEDTVLQNTHKEHGQQQLVHGNQNDIPNATPHKVPQVVLENREEWLKFHRFGNEMAVVNVGRTLNPTLEYSIGNLELNSIYRVGIRLEQVDDHIYKYDRQAGGIWEKTMTTVPIKDTIEIVLEDLSGEKTMKNGVSFKNLKICNIGDKTKTQSRTEEVELMLAQKRTSMLEVQTQCKYVPRMTIYKVHPDKVTEELGTFKYEETSFIVVTSYKNEELRDLKNSSNKYCRNNVKNKAREATNGTPAVPYSRPTLRGTKKRALKGLKEDIVEPMTTPLNTSPSPATPPMNLHSTPADSLPSPIFHQKMFLPMSINVYQNLYAPWTYQYQYQMPTNFFRTAFDNYNPQSVPSSSSSTTSSSSSSASSSPPPQTDLPMSFDPMSFDPMLSSTLCEL